MPDFQRDSLRPSLKSHALEATIFVAWVMMVLILMSRHAIWFDEARAWLIATRTPHWPAMLAQTHADGHPIIWYALLRLGHAVYPDLLTLYVIQFIFAALAAFYCLSLRNVPLSLRLLMLFGGILGFEYAVVARNYAPAVAALLAFAYYFPNRNERPWLLGFLLAFALNVHAGLAPIIPFLLLPWLFQTNRIWRNFTKVIAIVVIGYLTLALSVYPRHPDSIFTAYVTARQNPLLFDLLPSNLALPILSGGVLNLSIFPQNIHVVFHIALTIIAIGGCLLLSNQSVLRLSICGCLIASSIFYGLAYPVISYRHSALVVVAIFVLIAIDDRRCQSYPQHWGSPLALRPILAIQFVRLFTGLALISSSSHEAAAILKRPEFSRATLYCIDSHLAQSLAALGSGDCHMHDASRIGSYPLYLMSDLNPKPNGWADVLHWMETQERAGHPAIIYIHHVYLAQITQAGLIESVPTNPLHGKIEILMPIRRYLYEEGANLIRLKPEYRAAPSPSALPYTDR